LFISVILTAAFLTQASRTVPVSFQPPAKRSPHIYSTSAFSHFMSLPQGRKQTDEATYGAYVLRIYHFHSCGSWACLRIFKHGRLVYSSESSGFTFGGNFEGSPKIPIGTDVLGDCKPDALVVEWTGGAHCCFMIHVFELGEKFKHIARIEADDSDHAGFVDLNHDGTYEFVGYDCIFAYWGTSFMSSPAPRIVLKYRNGKFHLAADLMRTPAPSAEELSAMVRSVRSDEEWCPSPTGADCDVPGTVPVSLWAKMLDLMYGGHANPAWRLLDESWLLEKQEKINFIGNFCDQLIKSRYWPELKSLVGGCPQITATHSRLPNSKTQMNSIIGPTV
jgi:hypothetical protein